MNMIARLFGKKSHLSELVGQFGGLSREEAVQAATRGLEGMRAESDQAIVSAIGQLETIVKGAAKCSDAELTRQVLPLCDRIVTLAGTFGYAALDEASRSLCDLLDGLSNQGKSDPASVRVHVQTMRMFAPGATPLGEERTEVLLFELHKLLEFHGLAPPERSEDFSAAAAP